MGIWLTVVLFAVGIAFVVKGGDFFVDAAGFIAEISGIPKYIIGATIVSLATTLPEMIVSVIAAAEDKVDMAVGNAVGSVTANTGLILAIAIVFMSITIRRKDYIRQISMLICAAAALLISSLSGRLKLWGDIVLFAIFVCFVYDNLKNAKATSAAREKRGHTKKELGINILKFVLGAAGIIVGSNLLVDSGSEIALLLGVPERIIAVTMVAIGTSLPELVTTITAIIKKQGSLSIGNIIGANIIDITLILPVCSIVSGHELPIAAQSVALDMPACLIIISAALIPLLIRQKTSKFQGIVMLLMYAAYVALVL